MTTFVTQISVVHSEGRNRSNMLTSQIGILVDQISRRQILLSAGSSLSGQAQKALVMFIPDKHHPAKVTISRTYEGVPGTVVLDNVYGIFSIPKDVEYTVEYPNVAGAPDITIMIVES